MLSWHVQGNTRQDAGRIHRGLGEPRRSDIRVLHEMIRREAPQLEPYIAPGMLADIGRSCVRIKRMSDVDAATLAELVRKGADYNPA
jgi:hypothetical protein